MNSTRINDNIDWMLPGFYGFAFFPEFKNV